MNVRVVIAPPCRGGRDDGHLRHRLCGNIAKVHPRPDLKPHRFETAAQVVVGLQGVGRFVTRQP